MNGTATAGPPQTSPVEFVKSLPPEAKQAVFLALLREALAINGDRGLMPIDDEDGQFFGYYVPQSVAFALSEEYGPKLTVAEEQEIDRRLDESGQSIPIGEVIEDLKRRAAALRMPSPQTSASSGETAATQQVGPVG